MDLLHHVSKTKADTFDLPLVILFVTHTMVPLILSLLFDLLTNEHAYFFFLNAVPGYFFSISTNTIKNNES